MTDPPDAPRPRPTLPAAARGRTDGGVAVIGVVAEVLLTLGALTLLFVAWQLWIGDWIGAAQKNAAGSSISRQWAEAPPPAPAAATPGPTATASAAPVAPVVLPQPKDAQIFGVMHVPRFGADYSVPVAGGVTRPRTLDPIGIGHYPGTPMPGALGNVALAGHRTTFGKPFNRIADLRIGDAIVIETKAGWYTYRFRNLEYVRPDAVDVLLPTPQRTDVAATGRYLTMTSCSPMYFKSERIIAYSVFESFTPRGDPPPVSLAAVS
ncbi:class E sortase [Microbacterium kribbense]|uniref:Class E sortase n=1 Tax=Microbacterium kribbense TaxID=433645 RepID=A0ABP7FZY4_9MICO